MEIGGQTGGRQGIPKVLLDLAATPFLGDMLPGKGLDQILQAEADLSAWRDSDVVIVRVSIERVTSV